MANQYDRIFKENIGNLFLTLSEKQLGITIAKAEEIKDKLQTTLEREADFLRIIEDTEGNRFVLQLEFQVEDDKEMLLRMQEYHAILRRKYRLPIRQFVIYVGNKIATMPTQLSKEEIFEGFNLLDFQQLSYKDFLQSALPEEIMLAILCNFGQEEVEDVLEKIIQNLQKASKNDLIFGRYTRQVLVLSQLRDFHRIFKEKINNMAITFDVEEDLLFERGKKQGEELGRKKGEELGRKKGEELGRKQGEEQTKIKGIQNALKRGKLTLAEIAEDFEVSQGFILQVKEGKIKI